MNFEELVIEKRPKKKTRELKLWGEEKSASTRENTFKTFIHSITPKEKRQGVK